MKFGFFGTGYTGDITENFCCMAHGFADTDIDVNEYRGTSDYEGETMFGSYSDALALARKIVDEGKEVKAAIVFVNGKGGENQFLAELSDIVHCPIVGGTAARGDNPDIKNLPADVEVGVFYITDPQVSARAEFRNIHNQIIESVDVAFSDPRVIDTINGEDGAAYLKRKKAEYGLDEMDFEHMTLSTLDGVNNHMNKNDGVHIRSGRDLEPRMLLRYVAPEDAQASVEDYFDDKDAIIFGCAGLRSILSHTWQAKACGAFLFGEILTVNGRGDFGNLMLSKLYIEKQD